MRINNGVQHDGAGEGGILIPKMVGAFLEVPGGGWIRPSAVVGVADVMTNGPGAVGVGSAAAFAPGFPNGVAVFPGTTARTLALMLTAARQQEAKAVG